MKQLDKILLQIESSRKERGLTQAGLAELLAIDRTTYVRKEKGRIPITLREFLLIAKYLNLEPEYFLKTVTEKSKKF